MDVDVLEIFVLLRTLPVAVSVCTKWWPLMFEKNRVIEEHMFGYILQIFVPDDVKSKAKIYCGDTHIIEYVSS